MQDLRGKGIFRYTGQREFTIFSTRLQYCEQRAGIICEQDIKLTGFYSNQHYPVPLRPVKYSDAEFDRTLVFITNTFKLKEETAHLYKYRWQIEFFLNGSNNI